MDSVRQLCEQEKDGYKPNLFIVQESDVTTIIISQLYADQGLLIKHNAWYGQECTIIDLQNLEKGLQGLADVKELDIFQNWETF